LKKLLVSFLIFFSVISFSQEKKKLTYKAEIQEVNDEKFPGANILIGNVKMIHDGVELTCQQALYYQKQNFFKAFGNVFIKQGDTITQTSDYADYDANSKQTLSWGKVVLKDPTMTLTTDTLQFDRINQKLYYKTNGTIKDATNTLKSRVGTLQIR